MAVLSGLKGLPGLYEIDEETRNQFLLDNEEKLKSFKGTTKYEYAAKKLYRNRQYIDAFGQEDFDQTKNKGKQAFDLREKRLRSYNIRKEAVDRFSPWNEDGTRSLDKGLGNEYEKYMQMSDDGLLELLQSDYKTPSEFNEEWKEQTELATSVPFLGGSHGSTFGPTPIMFYEPNVEANKQFDKERNERLKERIYLKDSEKEAETLSSEVNTEYQSLLDLSDYHIMDRFKREITPGSYITDGGWPNLGVSWYAQYYGDGTHKESEMEEFGIDDMRQLLAKKKVYESYMQPDKANAVLNAEAQRYIKDHQSGATKIGLFANDVAISAASYTADKMNGLYQLVLSIQDMAGDLPTVWVNNKGEVVDPNIVKSPEDLGFSFSTPSAYADNDTMGYVDSEGNFQPVRKMEISRTALHNMGRNSDGSEDTSWLNPQKWSLREMYGVWDSDLAQQYAQGTGISPYKAAYDPNEDSDLIYEGFKMMSFGIADQASMVVPYGIGWLGKGLQSVKYTNALGSVVRGTGTALNWTGKFLGSPQVQGIVGAGGIAYAYGRGAFQETLNQNLSTLEEHTRNNAQNDVISNYNNNAEYKAATDASIKKLYDQKLEDYIKNNGLSWASESITRAEVQGALQKEASDEVFANLVSRQEQEIKNSDEYAKMLNLSIDGASKAHLTSFFPEAIKYGFVNTLGYRKYLYTNPTGTITRKVSQTLKGLREATTEGGRQRLAAALSPSTLKAKSLRLAKTTGSQFWGGVWTNGTDDMMVDAAERINEDSFSRYMQAFDNGDTIADTYGFADGLYSYWMGLNNSLGQETTMNAALVGGLGSTINTNIHFTNLMSLATKKGREAFRNRYTQRAVYDVDANGFRAPRIGEDGKPVTEKVSLRENWRDRLAFFVQNGILNEYYGEKLNEQDLQNHADYVNGLLDKYNDFEDIEKLIASDIAMQNAESEEDLNTARFLNALHSIHTLNSLGNSSEDAATLSSIVQNAKTLIDNISKLNTDKSGLTEEQVSSLLGQYFAHNPGLEQSDFTRQKALYQMSENAQELQRASKVLDEAMKEVSKVENNLGKSIHPTVVNRLLVGQALNSHWNQRLQTLRQDIEDNSSAEAPTGSQLISVVGGKGNAEKLIKTYTHQIEELNDEIQKQKAEQQKAQERLENANQKVNSTTESNAFYVAQSEQQEAQAAVEDAQLQVEYLEGLVSLTKQKMGDLSKGLQSLEDGESSKTLTADEIMSLEPVARARMLNPLNRSLYTQEQQNEIEKLEQQLLMRDGNALQKIQDISKLTQRIQANKDSYSRLSKHPEAAAVNLENQRIMSAKAAYELMDRRCAEVLVDFVHKIDEALQTKDDITADEKKAFVFSKLKVINSDVLDIIVKENLLPEYTDVVYAAKEISHVLEDINAVVNNMGREESWVKAIKDKIDKFTENETSKDGFLKALENAVDNATESQTREDLDNILSKLSSLGYQRNTVTLESRKQKREREEQQRKQQEADNLRTEAEVKAATEKAEATRKAEQAKAEEAPAPDFSNFTDNEEMGLEDEGPVMDNDYFDREKQEYGTIRLPRQQENGAIKLGDNLDMTRAAKQVVSAAKSAKDRQDFHDRIRHSGIVPATNELHRLYDAFDAYKQGKITEQQFEEYLMPAPPKDDAEKESTETPVAEKSEEVTEVDKKDSTPSQQNNETFVNVTEKHDDTLGDVLQGKSPSLRQQMDECTEEGYDVQESTVVPDNITNNQKDEGNSRTSTLSGVSMPEWVINKDIENEKNQRLGSPVRYEQDLANGHVLVHKRGNEQDPNDSMNNYFAWMESAGIKLQNIIDDELPLALAHNPHTKIKFMRVKPEDNATHDNYMQSHLLLVIDYDANVKKIHNNDNGGVITSDNKEYLIVGTVGYGNRDRNPERFKLWELLMGKMPGDGHNLKSAAWRWFTEKDSEGKLIRPSERFYVHQEFSTEIVPDSMIPGYIVRQGKSRRVSEVLASESNPHSSWTLDNAVFGIQYHKSFGYTGTEKVSNTVEPQDVVSNEGRAFVFIPAGNGKLIPAKLDALRYNECNKNCALWAKIQKLLMQCTSPNYEHRLSAINELSTILYFNADEGGDTILIGKDQNSKTITVVRGKQRTTFRLDSDTLSVDFMNAIENMNPRINVTIKALSDKKMRRGLDEIGALNTDLSKFGTAGVSYSIYGIDAEGKMILPPTSHPIIPETNNRQSDKAVEEFHYIDGKKYRYNKNTGEFTTQDGAVVTDDPLIKFAYQIQASGLLPVKQMRGWDYFILDANENPIVVKRSSATNRLEKLDDSEAKAIIEAEKNRIAEEKRAKAIDEALAELKEEKGSSQFEDLGDVGLENSEAGEVTFNEESEVEFEDTPQQPTEVRQPTSNQSKENKNDNKSAESTETKPTQNRVQTESRPSNNSTQTFNQMWRGRNRGKLLNVLKQKGWDDVPLNDVTALKEYLTNKGVKNLDLIGTSEEDFEAWLRTIECL